MELIVKKAFLFDFYGELLTEHQKNIYSDYVLNDIGISEIAAEKGISRQGVHELLKRCDKLLEGYEEKLHLVEKFMTTKKLVSEIQGLAEEFGQSKDESVIEKIELISNQILEEF